MYQRFAAVYDAMYSFKKYAEEAEKLIAIVDENVPRAKTLLDVACGTGEHIAHLKNRFQCVGGDISDELLEVARSKSPDIEFIKGDMRTFDLGRKFDVVSCLFGAIGYMLDQNDLTKALANMANHVENGGVLIVEPWLDKSSFKEGHYTLMTAETETMKIARANTTKREGSHSLIDFHFLVATTEGTEHFTEMHRMGLFSKDEYLSAFQAAGLSVHHDDSGLMGRGLFVAKRM